MIFKNNEEVQSLIKSLSKVPDWVSKARAYHHEMKALIYGDEYRDLLLRIEHIEPAGPKAEARKKYARPIKDINAKILDPVDNVYSASGGVKEYNIASDAQKDEFLRHISNARDGKSLEQWLQTYWSKDLYNIDPSGLMFLEWKDGRSWITYKSIDAIRSYGEKGMNIEYVVFEPKEIDGNKKLWRLVDDVIDYTIIEDGDTLTVSTDKDQTFKHPFGYCPGRICSDKKHMGKDYRLAPLDDIIDAEKEFLRDRSILTIYKFLNGFATPYRPKIVCPECHGTGKNGIDSCSGCDGKGFVKDGTDVVSEIVIPIDLTAENPIQLPTNFAGYISPPLEIWNQYRQEQKIMFSEMFEAVWGTRESEEVKDQTAMGAILNTQPMIAKLNGWSDVAQSHESFFTELFANFYISNKKKDAKICNIVYGRNYIIQPPEFLFSEYQKARQENAPVTILDRKLSEYITSKHKNDPQTLRVELMKKDLEPYVHFDLKLVFDIFGVEEAKKKAMFTDWWETLTEQDKTKTKEQLEAMRDEWYSQKIIQPVINP
jgi:hypothetical protein